MTTNTALFLITFTLIIVIIDHIILRRKVWLLERENEAAVKMYLKLERNVGMNTRDNMALGTEVNRLLAKAGIKATKPPTDYIP